MLAPPPPPVDQHLSSLVTFTERLVAFVHGEERIGLSTWREGDEEEGEGKDELSMIMI